MTLSRFDPARLDAFRAVLADYDIVATGIKTLLQQLPALDGPAARVMETKLGEIEQALELDREALWRFQVSDGRLADLLAELDDDSRGEDPLSPLSAHLVRAKQFLSPVSHAIEALLPRSHDALPEIVVCDDAQRRHANTERVAYEVAFGRTHLHSTPLRYILDTTSRCNLRCLTCYQSANQDAIHYDLADAPLGMLQQPIRQAQQVFVAGMGEPFLSRSAFELIAWAKSGGTHVEAITNGTTLARAARALPGVDVFMISFDGGTAASFEAIRRHANFSRVVAAIRDLTDAERRKICFNVVVCKQNVYTLGYCVELAMSLRIGQVHLQDMQAYLPWHGAMELDDADRAWLFRKLPVWEGLGRASGLTVWCNLVRNRENHDTLAIDTNAATQRNLDAVVTVPAPPAPQRSTLEEAARAIAAFLKAAPPYVFQLLTAAMQRLDIAPEPLDEQAEGEPDWTSLRAHVDAGQAIFPHCLATYAHMIVNGDGTTRSCCKTQNRLGVLSSDAGFGALWNAAPYVELRTAHAAQAIPRAACADCRDPVRFHFLPDVLRALDGRGVDIARIRKPADFPVPSSSANHPLVRKLGSAVAGVL